MIRIRTILVFAVLASLTSACRGEDRLEQRLAKLEAATEPNEALAAKVRSMAAELGTLRAELTKIKTESAAGAKPEEIGKTADKAPAEKKSMLGELPDWVKKVKLSGDLRYRYEYIDDESKTAARNRNRIRARLGLNAKVSDEWNLGFRLATGEGTQGGDPVSTNQTLGGSWSRRPFWLDLAFLNYQPQWAKGMDVFAGKIEFPFYRPAKNQLIWDPDLSPEGGALLYSIPLGEKTSVNLGAGGFWVVERITDVDTSFWGAQAYVKQQISGPAYVLGDASGYWYGRLRGQPALSLQWQSPTSNFFGNSNAGGLFTSEYNLFEVFGEIGTQIGKIPVAAFGDYVVNTAAVNKSQDTGWMIGATLNKAKDPGSWQFDYDYRDIQADAVVGQFNDSDFVGGGTGGRGHRFGFSYVLTNNIVPSLTYYVNQYEGRNNNVDYNRLQADIVAKF